MDDKGELHFLCSNRFTLHPAEENPVEEIFAQDWKKLVDSRSGADWELLRDICVELNFPIREGQSQAPGLLAALKRGILPQSIEGAWIPSSPKGIRVYLHPTPVGRLPVIECEDSADYIRLHQSLVCRCEPCHVPDFRGATIVKKYNNWARANMHRENGAIPKDPTLYRDYIALLSHRYYSGIVPDKFGLEPSDWKHKSLILRREHEAAHYMTQRYYGSTKSEIHDEIIADFMGLTAAFGEYDPDKFLEFLGLENASVFREGGRLKLYLSVVKSDSEKFAELCKTIRKAARNVATLYSKNRDRTKIFHILCRTSVADMAQGCFAKIK